MTLGEKARDDIARAIAMVEGINLDWITDQTNPRWSRYRQLADAAIETYEAANPVAPMSTSGEMVARLRKTANVIQQAYSDPHDYAILMRDAASRLEALEALVAEKAEALYWALHRASVLRDRVEIAEAALAKAKPE
ncbi:MAG TPA: hypothetical protein VIU82_00325 [Bosea sp. (in: a-proteobacteria)]